MDETIISAPAVAKDTRTLATRRRASPVVVPIEKASSHAAPEAPAQPQPPQDLHEECRARERSAVEAVRRELEDSAARELEMNRDAARSEGHAKGVDEGKAAALAEARAAIAAQGAQLEALLARIGERHEAALASAREGAVAIGFAAACRILGEKVVTGEGVRGIVEQLLAKARAGERVTVRLNGDDLASLRECAALEELAAGRAADFVEDTTLARGDCCVDTGAGTLEAIFAAQVEALRAALLAAHVSASGEQAR